MMLNQIVVTATFAVLGTITGVDAHTGFIQVDGKETMLHPCQLTPCMDVFGEFAAAGLPDSFWQIEANKVAA